MAARFITADYRQPRRAAGRWGGAPLLAPLLAAGLFALAAPLAAQTLPGQSPQPPAQSTPIPPPTGAALAELQARLGNDSCRWANDRECDDVNFGGTGACQPGTDASDCRPIAMGGDDSCQWANDGECDEPGIGTGACTTGTDTTDCAAVAFLRNRTNNCEFAFNNICDEPGTGTGQCAIYTDTADCAGRLRPAEARDHFFGNDDRVLLPPTEAPWQMVGVLQTNEGTCTASLIAPNLLATAAHCLRAGNGLEPIKARSFRAGVWGTSDRGSVHVVAQLVAPDYTPQSAAPGQGNGNDWAILTIDRPLGDELGFLRPYVLTKDDVERINQGGEFFISQAGYSWDTGNWLSGNLDCRILTAYNDGTFIHNCDTTSGDSGSPLMTRIDGEWRIVAVDSQFYRPLPPYAEYSSSYLSVDTRAFEAELRAAGAIE